MIPIHELLNRIRWDEEFAQGEFQIAYYDRLSNAINKVAFEELYFDPNDHFAFQIIDDEGTTQQIPLHRVREVYKDGKLIWSRHA